MDGVEGGAFEELIAGDPEAEAVVEGAVGAEAADLAIVFFGGVEWKRFGGRWKRFGGRIYNIDNDRLSVARKRCPIGSPGSAWAKCPPCAAV